MLIFEPDEDVNAISVYDENEQEKKMAIIRHIAGSENMQPQWVLSELNDGFMINSYELVELASELNRLNEMI